MSFPRQKTQIGAQPQDHAPPSDPSANSDRVLTVQSPLFKRQNKEVSQKNPDVWRKIVKAQMDHVQFLDKLGINEEAAMKAHYEDAGKASLMHVMYEVKGSAMRMKDDISVRKWAPANTGTEIPWKKRDVSNPIQERKKIFDTFNKTGGELPRSPPKRQPTTESQLSRPISRKISKKKLKKTPKFHDEVPEAKKPPAAADLYKNAGPKVDTGLNESRKPAQRYTSTGVPVVHQQHHPLTIAPRMPENFGHQNYETIRSNRAATIANVTARLYQERLQGRISTTSYRKLQSKSPVYPGQVGIPSWDSTTSIRQAPLRIPAITRPSNQIQILRAPTDNMTSSTSAPGRALAFHPVGYSGATGMSGGQKPRITAPVGGPRRRYKPSQLMPLHVPGPKYDNIYIGPYSGSESDRDSEDNMDRPVKSRKR